MRRRRSGLEKEKIIMLASSVLVLTALTVTGLYVRNQKKPVEPEEQIEDISSSEKTEAENISGLTEEMPAEMEAEASEEGMDSQVDLDALGELDYAPLLQEVGSGNVTNPTAEKVEGTRRTLPENDRAAEEEVLFQPEGVLEVDAEAGTARLVDEEVKIEKEAVEEAVAEAVSAEAAERELYFDDSQNLVWPIVGNVLLKYSMDKAIFFPTLQQYKYNPAIVIAAVEGDNIANAADGRVKSIYNDASTGTTLVMDIGSGYEVTYGQMKNVTVKEGDYVKKGAVLGQVAAPSRAYSVEGTNVYFKLCKDGSPVNPMNRLG